MDFTAAVAYNGLDVNTSTRLAAGGARSGYQVKNFRPGPVDVTQFLDSRSVRDGIDASDVFLGARHVRLIDTVSGSTAADFYDKLQAFLAAFTPTVAFASDSANLGFLPLTFSQPTTDTTSWTSGLIPMQLYLRPVEPPTYDLDRDTVGGAASRGISLPVTASLLARDPRKYAQTESSHTITTSATSATNLGDYPTAPTITIVSAATTGALTITVGPTAFGVTIDAASTTYTIDCANTTFYKATTARPDLISVDPDYPFLEAGANNTNRSALTGVAVTMTYRHAWA